MHSKDLIKLLKKHGYEQVRVKGSHHQFKLPETGVLITVPHPKKDMATGTLRRIMKDAGLE